jgi:hypothetical protein
LTGCTAVLTEGEGYHVSDDRERICKFDHDKGTGTADDDDDDDRRLFAVSIARAPQSRTVERSLLRESSHERKINEK